ncbi:DUF3515 domain-containing protein [Salinibacterium sp. SYSU T00001]|uniref:DUF3515 domain-containing protein n=1 Tax=Homoserinimonas sedimenticola TaxID=2986805 RepID=UPI0022356A89|nr:DUF3515 domain-containing protein [Salinibacterium sedimenticola]MCW4384900.1 DUF3515 domain-containing protein [Salinibacterium sedimenticola]
MFSKTRTARVLAAAGTIAALSGCSPVVPMTAAPDATSVECADVTVRLPDAIDELERRETDAQSTAAWGSPAAVFFHCGVEVPGPSALPCFSVRGIDWLRDDADAPTFVFTTYGRDPAVRVVVDSTVSSGTSALVAMANAVGTVPAERECTAAEDVLGVPEVSGDGAE